MPVTDCVKQGLFALKFTTDETRIVHKIPEESRRESILGKFSSVSTSKRYTRKFVPSAVCIVFSFCTSSLTVSFLEVNTMICNEQLVRASHGYHEVTGSIQKSWLLQASIHNCINYAHNCEDHSLLDRRYQHDGLGIIYRKFVCAKKWMKKRLWKGLTRWWTLSTVNKYASVNAIYSMYSNEQNETHSEPWKECLWRYACAIFKSAPHQYTLVPNGPNN